MSGVRPVGLAAAAAVLLIGAAAVVLWWPVKVPEAPAAQGAPAPAAAQIEGRVTLAAGSPPVPAGATVVVYAYAVEGTQVPLAVLRLPASALPMEFKLDDSLAPSAEHRLSRVQRLVIGARLGPGGEALAQVGDWLAASQTLVPGAKGVQLVLQPPPK